MARHRALLMSGPYRSASGAASV